MNESVWMVWVVWRLNEEDLEHGTREGLGGQGD